MNIVSRTSGQYRLYLQLRNLYSFHDFHCRCRAMLSSDKSTGTLKMRVLNMRVRKMQYTDKEGMRLKAWKMRVRNMRVLSRALGN
jgi:hypothetical protein